MHSVRLARVAVMLGMLGCGSDDTVIASRAEEQEQSPSTGGKVDAGKSGSKSDAGTKSEPKPPPEEEPAITSTPKSDAAVEEENCGEDNVRTGPVVPDILIVLDRSGSMRPDDNPNLRCDALDQLDPITQGIRFGECLTAGINCDNERDKMTVNCGGTQVRSIDRWTPSVAAIKKLTTEFDDDVSFGLITFPGEGRGNNASCMPGSLQVPVGLGKAAAINMVLSQTQPGGGTPTGEALQTALTEFRKLDAADGVRPARYVLLVTDGQPTCPNGGGGMRQNGAAADKKLTLDALDALAKDGVKTYVIGYDAALDPALAMALTEFAQHGGTERYYAVQDETSLAEAFKTISTAVIRCDIELAFKAWRPDYLHVILDDKELKAGDPDGYRLEGQTVILEGAACMALQEGKGHRVEVTMDCVALM